jgi:hypothetical protein
LRVERDDRAAAARDSRVRYVRSEVNRGVAWNLNNAAGLACGEYFVWASHDDLHSREFIEGCVAMLDADPGVVYAYATTYLMDGDGVVFGKEANRFTVSANAPNRRFWEQLVVRGGQNFYGMIRGSVLHSIGAHGTTPWAERVMFGELSLFDPGPRTMTATGPGFSFQVFGSKGSVRLEGVTHVAGASSEERRTRLFGTCKFQPAKGDAEIWQAATTDVSRSALEAFAKAAQGGAAYPITLEEMIHGSAVTEAIVRSATSGNVEKVS